MMTLLEEQEKLAGRIYTEWNPASKAIRPKYLPHTQNHVIFTTGHFSILPRISRINTKGETKISESRLHFHVRAIRGEKTQVAASKTTLLKKCPVANVILKLSLDNTTRGDSVRLPCRRVDSIRVSDAVTECILNWEV